jgi:ribosomal protein S18 acetylase RimI-like enzyme
VQGGEGAIQHGIERLTGGPEPNMLAPMPPGPPTDRTEPVEVRPVRVEDAASLHQLYGELADGRADALPAGMDRTREILAGIVSQPARRLLVAEVEGGHLAGTVDVLTVTNLTHTGRPWAVVENVVVAEAHRRRGIGRALMQEAMRHARRVGCYKVQLTSGKHRAEAHAFYRSLGFEAVAEGFKAYFD